MQPSDVLTDVVSEQYVEYKRNTYRQQLYKILVKVTSAII